MKYYKKGTAVKIKDPVMIMEKDINDDLKEYILRNRGLVLIIDTQDKSEGPGHMLYDIINSKGERSPAGFYHEELILVNNDWDN